MTNDGSMTRAEILDRLKKMFDERATMAPGMASPYGVPYGVFNVLGAVPGFTALALFWDVPAEIKAVMVGSLKVEATDDQLLTVLAFYEKRVQDYIRGLGVPIEGGNRCLRLPAGVSDICREILPNEMVH